MPPLGYNTYLISVKQKFEPSLSDPVVWEKENIPNRKSTPEDPTFTIENHFLRLTFSNKTGAILSIFNKVTNVQTNLQNNFLTYFGDPDLLGTPEGAYIFAPLGPAVAIRDAPQSFQVLQVTNLHFPFFFNQIFIKKKKKGKYVQEVRQVYTDFCSDAYFVDCGVTQTFRLYVTDDSIAEIENFVEVLTGAGPVGLNHDVITRFTTSINSNLTIYTDNNCFEAQPRIFDPNKYKKKRSAFL